ncbi:MAG: ZIP family metal transporter [Bacilli bacterium]|nr:ZIP family metal transporter [Bacilli bacterium]
MSNTVYGFVLTILAGLSTLLGSIIIFIKVKNKENMIVASLGFAAGVMLCVSIFELIPEGFSLIHSKYTSLFSILLCLLCMNIGLILSGLIDKYMPSGNNSLYKVGLISMVAIVLHNIPEGIATFLASSADKSLGLSLAIAIALHNIPEGISISVPIYYATGKKKKAFLYTFISGLSEPVGAILAYFFLKPFVTNTIMGMLFCFIAGIMIHISTYELLKEAKNYQKKSMVISFLLIGVVFMLINLFVFH